MSESRINKIAIIGAGSVAIHLGLALKHAGYNVEHILNRNREKGMLLAKKLGALYVSDFDAIKNCDLVILAVTDDAIPIISGQLSGSLLPIVHTSGTVSKEVFSQIGSDYGVFYPLQTFSVNHAVDFSKVPICIDSSNTSFTARLILLAQSLSQTVCQIDDQKRRIIHLAGVFASNFSNYLYAIAEDILIKNEIPFELLLPLIQETAIKIQTINPLEAQTGPAKRGDFSTIQKHMALLQDEPELLDLYKKFTDNILKTYSHQMLKSDPELKDEI